MRVLLLNNVPAPYFDPLFARVGQESGWELTVCYSSSWNQDVGWKAETVAQTVAHQTVILDRQRPWLKTKLGSSLTASASLLEILWRERPDCLLIYGYTLLPQMTALLWAMATRTPYVIAGDANLYNDAATGWKRFVKSFWLKLVVRRAAALLAVGTANRLFWQSYGARAERIFDARFAVDNEFFARESLARQTEAQRLRQTLGLAGKVVFLFVGRLVKRKNVDLILRAARQLNDERIAVVIAGSGEERDALEALAAENSQIVFAGNVAPKELPLFYALADALVLPAGREPWGLVVNEAMACGLAVVAHKHCGAAVDLVDADNGAALNGFSVDELAAAMQRIAADQTLRHSMQQRSRERIQAWTIEAAARGIIQAVESAARKQPAVFAEPALRKER
ncbi:MAG TPA: glycosyltransferase family 4 protein [Blastocatellia bacterium]|nr:glycosyltransferase family 4 protein [Blastocatellia bacterium]HMX25939.1 glycosyltransferase family 4 protein [Blastocatellia bacterium]HMY70495.1 glycosyltransferase family 4 protein [Blastocatellia bacterium]HMZ17924.1 glycosyltransferase family 4 protein [Blastocatellia bacterium]HNG29407.1 glycosyltransferase family 4 protein [Blastocatellia bacterium]